MRQWTTPLLFVVACAAWPSRTEAEPAVCLSAPVDGQKLRKDEKLLAARDKFLACAQKVCPAEVVDDCARWASEVETALPSVTFAARDATGKDLSDARAAVDGGPPAALGDRPRRLDPGTHTVLVRLTDGKEVRREFVLREGEKAREIVATFGVPLDATGAPIVAAVVSPSSTSAARPVPLTAWVAGGVAAGAFVSFVTAGALGLASRASNHCDVACSSSAYDDVEAKFHVADASLAIGVVALGVAGWFYFTRPAVPPQTAWVEVGPGSLRVQGRF